MDQQHFKFTDDQSPSHHVKLDKERQQSLLDLMGSIVSTFLNLRRNSRMSMLKKASKISSNHFARKAIVYVRQSTTKQVRHNQESQRLQYALKDRAAKLGFNDIEVIDKDLGISAGSGARQRPGFQQLLASVALGDVGIILSRELSRLSRTDKDWCHLMKVCQIFDTLLGDEQGIYDTSTVDDQLILGIKGSISVAELNVLKLRMQQGKEAKARQASCTAACHPVMCVMAIS